MLAPTNNTAQQGEGRRERRSSHTHSDTPSSPQPPAQTSNHQPAVVGKRLVVWLCETRIPFSLSTSAHTHTPDDATMEKCRGREEEEEEEVEWEGQPSAAPMDAVRVTRHHSCTTVPAHEEWDSEGERRSECGHQMCADHTLCMACMACSHHPNHTFDTVTTPCRWHVNRQRGRRGREKREEGAAHSFPPTSRWHTPPLISSPSLFPSPSSSLSLTHNTHSHHHPH